VPSTAIEFPAFALENDLGTIQEVSSLKELLEFEYFDIEDQNYTFWDASGRQIAFDLHRDDKGVWFTPYIDESALAIGSSQMFKWAERHDVTVDRSQSWRLGQLYQFVVQHCPEAET
jgi:hypothetical protein